MKTKKMNLKNNKLAENLPDALQYIDEILQKMGSKKPALFLDYDGTLSPIVSNPEDAILSDEAKEVLTKLSKEIKVAILSGRDRLDIQERVGIKELIYAGSHGFDIKGPNNINLQYEPGKHALPQLDEAEKHLQEKFKDIKGAQVERKKYAIAVHYRNVAENDVGKVIDIVKNEIKLFDKLKVGKGKMILELKPDLDWNKGRAMEKLLEELKLGKEENIPLFIGDDVTDEDALKAIRNRGVGIIVGSHEEKTAASYSLEDTVAVIKFLNVLFGEIK